MDLIKQYPEHAGLINSLNQKLRDKLKRESNLGKKLHDTSFRVKLMFLNSKGH